jgi:hypothetical protein
MVMYLNVNLTLLRSTLMKPYKIEIDKQGRYLLWKLNKKGFYNFIKYLDKEEIKKYEKGVRSKCN